MSAQLKKIQEKVDELGEKIDAPSSLLVVRDQPAADGAPYVAIIDKNLFYISSERGYELFRKRASSLDELLYFIFDRVTSRMAGEYEIDNRVEGQDSRRIYFAKKIELMNKLDSRWGYLTNKKVEGVLISAPYLDSLSWSNDSGHLDR